MLVVLGCGFVVPATQLLGDADTYWHLAAGRWILEHKTVPRVDVFSHSMAGAPWTAHEWLAELIMVMVHRAASWAGLVWMTAIAYAAALARLTRFLLHRLEPVHALAVVAFAVALTAPHLLARPHVLAWVVLVLWLAEIVEAVERRRLPAWWMLGLMVIWANLHGSFTLGIGLAAGFAVEAVLAAPVTERRAVALRWLAFLAGAGLATLLNPQGWGSWEHAASVTRMQFALRVIGEWQSPNFQHYQPLELWLMVVLALALAGRLQLPWLRMVLVLGLLHMALKHQRHVAVLGLVTPLLLAGPIASALSRRRGSRQLDAEQLDRLFAALVGRASRAAQVLAWTSVALVVWATAGARDIAPSPRVTPEAALAVARSAGVSGPVLNSYDFGGYLIDRGVPVFIDGRGDMYGDVFIERSVKAVQLHEPKVLAKLVDEYHIGWTMLQPGTPAIALLDTLPDWRRIYADDNAVVHMRVAN
jgi:hypothetical protein